MTFFADAISSIGNSVYDAASSAFSNMSSSASSAASSFVGPPDPEVLAGLGDFVGPPAALANSASTSVDWSKAFDAGTMASVMRGVGAMTKAYGTYSRADAESMAMAYQAQTQRNNQQYAEYQAQGALRKGASDEQALRLRVANLKGAQRARLAANGVDLSEGSALNILTDTDFMGNLDALRIRDNAALEAWAYREQGKGYAANAEILKGKSDSISPMLETVGSLLTDAEQVSSFWKTLAGA